MEIRIRNKKTTEVLHFSDDWEVVGEKRNKAKIKGEKYIGLFKHWANVNKDTLDKTDKIFIYRKDDDMLFYNASTPRCSYGIGFISLEALEDLEDGELYSYCDLVGEEK